MSRWLRKRVLSGIIVMMLLVVSILLAPVAVAKLSPLLYAQPTIAYSAFVLLLVIAVVCAPVTIMPLLPIASGLFGPSITGVLSVLGWTIGAVLVFVIVRAVGKSVTVSKHWFRKLNVTVRDMPSRKRWLLLIVLRVVFPVDVISYVIAAIPSIGFREYVITTVLGVSWFSFAFPYLGTALLEKNTFLFLGIACSSVALFVIGSWVTKSLISTP